VNFLWFNGIVERKALLEIFCTAYKLQSLYEDNDITRVVISFCLSYFGSERFWLICS